MPDIIILPSKKEMEQLRRLLIRYRNNEIDEREIEELIIIMMRDTYELSKTVTKFTGD